MSDHPGAPTFCNSSGFSVVDLVWVDFSNIERIADLSITSDPCVSDHFPVKLSLQLYGFDPAPHSRVSSPMTKNPLRQLKWNVEDKEAFLSALGTPPPTSCPTNCHNPLSHNDLLHKSIHLAAENAGMVKPITRAQVSSHRVSRIQSPRWYDEECKRAKRNLSRSLRELKLGRYSPALRLAYAESQKGYKALLDAKKGAFEADVANRFAEVRNASSFWAAVKSCRPYTPCKYLVTLDRWHTFLAAAYPPRLNRTFLSAHIQDPTLDSHFMLTELHRAIRSLRPGKAAGPDGISSEFLMALPEPWLFFILDLFNNILDSETVPTSWSNALLTMIHKKGDQLDPHNYRGIALMGCVTKLFTSMLKARLQGWVLAKNLIPESQTGFLPNRSCSDNIFVLTSVIQSQLRLGGRTVYALFVDFKRAFDSINHDKLWSKLCSMQISTKFISIMKSLYDQATVRVKHGSFSSDPIEVTEGVLQGEILSPLLFILFIADLESFLRDRDVSGISVNGLIDVLILLYADDLVILAYSPSDLRRKLALLYEYCEINGLSINKKKTQIIPFKARGRNGSLGTFRCGPHEIEVVKSYPYLGTMLSSSSLGLLATDYAVQKARIATGTALSILKKAKSDNWASNEKIFDSIVVSTLLYAAPIWGLRYCHLLERAQMFFLKRLFFLPRGTPNFALRLELNIAPIELKLFALSIGWVIRLLDMNDHRLPKICLLRQLQLHNEGRSITKFNWVSQLSDMLKNIHREDIWDSVDPEVWRGLRSSLIEEYAYFLRTSDLTRFSISNSLQTRITFAHDGGLPIYLASRTPFNFTRSLVQLRMATDRLCVITIAGDVHKLDPTLICSLCNLNECETISHILLSCPLYNSHRNYYLRPILNASLPPEIQTQTLLAPPSLHAVKMLHYFIKNALRLRVFCTTE